MASVAQQYEELKKQRENNCTAIRRVFGDASSDENAFSDLSIASTGKLAKTKAEKMDVANDYWEEVKVACDFVCKLEEYNQLSSCLNAGTMFFRYKVLFALANNDDYYVLPLQEDDLIYGFIGFNKLKQSAFIFPSSVGASKLGVRLLGKTEKPYFQLFYDHNAVLEYLNDTVSIQKLRNETYPDQFVEECLAVECKLPNSTFCMGFGSGRGMTLNQSYVWNQVPMPADKTLVLLYANNGVAKAFKYSLDNLLKLVGNQRATEVQEAMWQQENSSTSDAFKANEYELSY